MDMKIQNGIKVIPADKYAGSTFEHTVWPDKFDRIGFERTKCGPNGEIQRSISRL